MRVAIATENGYVAQHFGRCPGFTIFDVEDGKVVNKTFRENPGYRAHQPGAVPMFLKNQNVDCVIAGGMGPNAVMNLQAAGIKVIIGVTGNIDEIMNKFINDTLISGKSLCKRSHGRCEH